MPTYTYKCQDPDCVNYSVTIELNRSIHDSDKTAPCFECEADMQKVLVRSTINLKGDGWYKGGVN